MEYTNQDQEEEIILNQDDVDKQASAYLHLRLPPAPTGQAQMYGPSYQGFDEPNLDQWAARSAALAALEHGPRRGQSPKALARSQQISRKNSAGKSEPRGARAPESQKSTHFPQKIMAPGTGSLERSDFSLGCENARHDADVNSFNGADAGQAAAHGQPQGHRPSAQAQNFPIKTRHMFTKSQ